MSGAGDMSDDRLRRKIILSNQLAFTASCIIFTTGLLFSIFIDYKPIFGYTLMSVLYSMVIVLNKYKRYNTSRLHLTILPTINLLVVSGFTSLDVNVSLKFAIISVIVAPLVLFDIREKKLLVFGISWVIGMYYLTDIVNPYIPVFEGIDPGNYDTQTYININSGLTFLILIMGFIHLQRINVKAEDKAYQLYLETCSQKVELQDRNEKITDSLRYATYIQHAVLSRTEVLDAFSTDYFLLFKPKDIVSGDFYMFKNIHNKLYVVVADGTGHGVPGAFMSMLGISFLTEVLRKSEGAPANQALNELRKQIKFALHQQEFSSNSRDGMDLAMLVVDHDTMQAQFAGANRPMLLVKATTGEQVEIKGDRMQIGISEREYDFKNNEFTLEKGDSVYMYSDGYIDQLGGEEGKQFKSKRFRELVSSVASQPMKIQQEFLEYTHNNWRRKESQTDDILVVGIRF